ncbi:hypothetical protein IFM89_004220 [Coptis chinensis]|uniref:Auxin-responsive protein n=1 Tax=Coptis chinensis TaxID=261450 RepID=A0A835I750_9MAGN|nr:hypothetical protein IFM89_004220 [Coptis chinensis]
MESKITPETELTLGLPGDTRIIHEGKSCAKRGFSQTVDLKLGCKEPTDDHSDTDEVTSSVGKFPPAPKTQVVALGWPPVRSTRRNLPRKKCTYVKVAVDGAPYLRKVDLEMHGGYTQLLSALEEMFTCFTIRNYVNESKLMDPVNGTEYVPTYEDKDGDWMLVGDVPWKMFIESCKRLRLMKSSEAVGLGCSSSSYAASKDSTWKSVLLSSLENKVNREEDTEDEEDLPQMKVDADLIWP